MINRAWLSFVMCACIASGACGKSGNDPADDSLCESYCRKARACAAEESPNHCVRLCEALTSGSCADIHRSIYECGDRSDFECRPDDNELPLPEDCPTEYDALQQCLLDGGTDGGG
jgi:hypothetical protein